MTREYHLPTGEAVPPELQEQIADDVRAFDAAQTPEARSATALRKISNELPRLRGVLDGSNWHEQTTAQRRTVAAEIQVLLDLGFTPEQIIKTPQAVALVRRYGLITEEETL